MAPVLLARGWGDREPCFLAGGWDVGIHIHVGELRDEVQMSLDECSLPLLRWLDEFGALNNCWQLVYCKSAGM